MDQSWNFIEEYRLKTVFRPDEVEHHCEISDPVRGIRRGVETIRWRRVDKLGRGSFGDVWLEHDLNGKRRAVKQIDKVPGEVQREREHIRELIAMARLAKVRYTLLLLNFSAC